MHTPTMGRPRVLTLDEENRLLESCKPALRMLIEFAIDTGCRLGEIQKLRWNNVDLKKRYAKIDAVNTKSGRSRVVPLSPRVVSSLEQAKIKNSSMPNDLIFSASVPRKAFVNACAAAGLPNLKLYDLRETAISRMQEVREPSGFYWQLSG